MPRSSVRHSCLLLLSLQTARLYGSRIGAAYAVSAVSRPHRVTEWTVVQCRSGRGNCEKEQVRTEKVAAGPATAVLRTLLLFTCRSGSSGSYGAVPRGVGCHHEYGTHQSTPEARRAATSSSGQNSCFAIARRAASNRPPQPARRRERARSAQRVQRRPRDEPEAVRDPRPASRGAPRAQRSSRHAAQR